MNIKDFARSPLGLLVVVLGISLAVFSIANLYFTPVQVKQHELNVWYTLVLILPELQVPYLI